MSENLDGRTTPPRYMEKITPTRYTQKWKFGDKDKEESQSTKYLQDAKDFQEEALEKARQVLHSEPCKDFLESYKVAEREIIDVLLKYSKEEHDPVKFGFAAKDLLSNLAHLKAMLDILHKKAGKEYTDV